MKHALTVLTNAAEVAETNAPKRDAAAEAYARDGEHERAENLRAQAELDRVVAAECREAIAKLEHECGQIGTLVTALVKIADECPDGEIDDAEADRILARISDIANDALDSVTP